MVDWCCLCKNSGETIDHLLLHCEAARELWLFALTLPSICWVMPKRIVELFGCWRGVFGKHHINVVWNTIPHCTMWVIWRERNKQTFKRKKSLLLN